MTNYEAIKQMSIEEMHEFFINIRKGVYGASLDLPEVSGKSYNDMILVWLQTERGEMGVKI